MFYVGEATPVANIGAVSSSIKMADGASSSSNTQGMNFELLDSLYYAAANGDMKKFEEHSSDQLDQILTPNGNTILHIHITARPRTLGQDFVREMIEMCPGLIWKANKKGETLLHMAARHGHADVVKLLLDECKKPYQNDQELGMEATRRMLEMINEEAKDSALHEAVRYNHLDVVRILTKEDPSLPYSVNKAGETPLYLAAERGYTKVVKRILRTCDSPADHGPFCRTALHTAVIRNDKGMATLLLDDRRIHKSQQDQQGWTPLHFAAQLGHFEIAKMLIIEDKSAAYKVDNEGKTALHVAASLGKVTIMRELISNCPGCCELVDNRGWNVLHFASTSENRKAVRLILQNPSLGNLVNEKDDKGNTPFLQAASMRFFIIHPKVDRLVFNNDNQNATDMVNPFVFFHPWKSLDLTLWNFVRLGIKRCRRIIPNNEEGKDKEDDYLNSKSNNETGKNNLIVATLIAVVTFAAGIALPGAFVAEKGTDQGAAMLTRNTAFRAFVVLNTMSMFWSTYAVITHISTQPATTNKRELLKRMRLRQGLIVYAMWAMIGAFVAGIFAVLRSDKILAISACIVSVAVLVFAKIINKRIE